MREFYQLDRDGNSLRPGYRFVLKVFDNPDQPDEIAYLKSLYPDGLSSFGWTNIEGRVPERQRVLVERERICESIRLSDYSHRPSRFTSIFAC